ncbi:transcriptional antiterminator [Erysipelothrix larvae]|uniref:Transcriptional antiterminator n=1 Tax=Erysipelothrix larvae TaxID=1514105 RepID=A0A0X8GZB9_9FIRM|nr:PRD domain-containing protein [Erysipelothrix larvae]AMC93203.1 transcriptional antiterminator [Erysipelothrix larvae]
MKEFKIRKVLTHNIILGSDGDNEYILIGKGIGFQKKTDDVILEANISSYYVIHDRSKLTDYEMIVLNTDDSVLLVTEKALGYAEVKLNQSFDGGIHISLLDHINFALYRLKNNIEVGSFFTEEYYLMYQDLYDIASEMVLMINEALDVRLPNTEIGSIILHLHAALNKEKVSTSALYAQIISFSLGYIQNNLPLEIPSDSIARTRLITHLKFALKRTEQNKTIDNPLSDVIREKYFEIYHLSMILSQEIESRFQVKLPESEIGYIALHIYNLQY